MTEAALRSTPFPADISALTGLRLFLALGVILFHYQLAWTPPVELAGLFNRSRLAVDIFFMLSGFILTHIYLRDGQTLDYGRFIVARLARIYPLHLVVLAGMGVMVAGASLVGVGLEPGRFNAPDFFSTLFMTHAWFPRQSLVLWNGPSWSLSAEWFAYLLFPAYAWIGLRLRARPWLILGMSALGFMAFDAFHVATMGAILPRSEDNMGILRILPEFLAGVGLYFLGLKLSPGRAAAALFAAVTTAALIVAMQIPLDDRLIVLLGAPFLLSIALLSKAGRGSVLSHPIVRFGGQISFAVYISHIPVLMVWRNAVQKLSHLSGDYRMGTPEILALLATSLIIAAALHLLVERPANLSLRRWAASRAPGRRNLASPAA